MGEVPLFSFKELKNTIKSLIANYFLNSNLVTFIASGSIPPDYWMQTLPQEIAD